MIKQGSVIYSDNFTKKGEFVVENIKLVANNSVTDKKIVAIIKAHYKDDKNFLVEATSDKFKVIN